MKILTTRKLSITKSPKALGIVFMFLMTSTLALTAQAADLLNIDTPYSFIETLERLEKAVVNNKMAVVAKASASSGAAARGVKIPGNAVVMVFRNDYAVRMLEASIPAGIEAPLRIYVTEKSPEVTTIRYMTPSAVFAPYGVPELNRMSAELDPIFQRIVQEASGSKP